MPTKIKPSSPDHFNCDGCGRTFHYSQREVGEAGEFCTNCAPSLSESDEFRILNWKREKLYAAAVEYRDAFHALILKRGIVGEIAPVNIEGPLISMSVGSGPVQVSVTEESTVADDEPEDGSLSDA